MKKIISLILCVLMLVPCFMLLVGAEGEEEQKPFNFALLGSAYATSKWNNDSDPKYINNGDQADSYRYWRPNGHGRDAYMDDSEQICGIRFQGGQYYEVQEVHIYNYMQDKSNDIKYVIEALVLGEWVVIGESRNVVPENVSTGIRPSGENGALVGCLTIDVVDTITKHIRVKVSEYGRWATSQIKGYDADGNPIYENAYDNPDTPDFDPQTSWHNWHLVPIIHELEFWGVEAPAPAWDVPEGAILSTNACLSGFADATSVNTIGNLYPALANDDVKFPTLSVSKPYWQANLREAGGGQSIWCSFDHAYDIVNVGVNFGGSMDGVTLTYDIQIQLEDGTWVTVVKDKTSVSSGAQTENTVYELDGTKRAIGVKVIFNEVKGSNGKDTQAMLTEMSALISPTNQWEGKTLDKCIFLKDYITADKKQSAATGNLAMFGTAYASSVMTYANMSSIDYINDGGVHDALSGSWFAQTFEKGTYCGVILQKNYKVDKVILYFNDPITGSNKGDCVMQFDIQAKIGDNFQTIKSGITSYDQKTGEYKVSIQFDKAVDTNDIRIVYTSNGLVFPYIKELEVYSSAESYRAYYGYPTGSRVYGGKTPNLMEDLAHKSVVIRSRYLDLISPIQYFEVLDKYNVTTNLWI